MKKIPTLFLRNPENMRELLDQPHPECQWVFAGEGVATRKYDGTCVKIEEGKYFKRREIKKGKPIPVGFIEIQYDENTGKRVGWLEVDFTDPSDKYHVEVYGPGLPDGTYELIGPKIQGNPECVEQHMLIKHENAEIFPDCPRTFNGLRVWLKDKDIEGIVFHHPDGRMGKIKKKDFGQKRELTT